MSASVSKPCASPRSGGDRDLRPCPGGAIVCHCHRVTAAQVEAAIEETGATSVEAITLRTKAGSSCQGCRCKLNRMLCGLSPNCGGFGFCGRCGCVQVLCACDAA